MGINTKAEAAREAKAEKAQSKAAAKAQKQEDECVPAPPAPHELTLTQILTLNTKAEAAVQALGWHQEGGEHEARQEEGGGCSKQGGEGCETC